jgi:hypothetical protein
MEGLTISRAAIEEVNRKLAQFVDLLQSKPGSSPLTAEHMAAVLAEVVRMGEWMRPGQSENAQGPLAEPLNRYRALLEQLQQLLPCLHAQLLTERSRLQSERAHLDAAAAWARSAAGYTP